MVICKYNVLSSSSLRVQHEYFSASLCYLLREKLSQELVVDSLGPKLSVREKVHSYGMQEAFVADQLLQGSEHSSDDLIWSSNSLFSSVKVPKFLVS